jgi:hypothetical protein
VAFLSYYLHWQYDELLAIEHHDRRDWVRQISAINSRINETA